MFGFNRNTAVDELNSLTTKLEGIEQVITRESEKLVAITNDLATAECNIASGRVDEALGGTASAGASAAGDRLAQSRAEVKRQEELLAGLRARLWTAATSLVQKVTSADFMTRLHEERESAARAFAGEWTAAAAAWSQVSARKAQIERLTGRRMALPEPAAGAAPGVQDVLPVHQAVKDAFDGPIQRAAQLAPKAQSNPNSYELPNEIDLQANSDEGRAWASFQRAMAEHQRVSDARARALYNASEAAVR